MSGRAETGHIRHSGALSEAMALHGGMPGDWLDLSTGISPFTVPLPDLDPQDWRRLPDPGRQAAVAEAARDHYGGAVLPVPTPGSQAAIQHLPALSRLADPAANDVAILSPTYGEYAAAFGRAGFAVRAVGDAEAGAEAGVLVLANPNNPDGRRTPPQDVMALARRRGARLTVVDEAFADIDPALSVVPHLPVAPGLVVLRSFGKFFGLAGLRLGFAFAADALARELALRLGPWAVSGPALAVAARVFSDPAAIAAQRRAIATAHNLTERAITAAGLPIIGGTGLFLLVDAGDGQRLRDRLAARHILSRAFDHSPRALRLGLVADEAEAARLTDALVAARAENDG